jgi:serine protease AprX
MEKNKYSFLFVLVLITSNVFGQVNRYMVFFKDKNGTPFSLVEPDGFLSPEAIARRIKHAVEVTEMDLPVNPAYLDQVKSTGAEVYFPTRWLNGVLIQCDATLVAAITALTSVDHVELVAPKAKLKTSGRKRSIEKRKTSAVPQATDIQLQMIGIDEMHKENIRGEGIVIGILDSGFEGVNITSPFSHLFEDGRVNLTVSMDYVYNSGDVFQFDDHGTEVLSVIAGYSPDNFTGGAYKASFQLYVTEEVPTEYRVEEYNWLFAAERADSAGVDVIHSSLGYYDFDSPSMDYLKSQMNGTTTVVSRAAQWAADRGIIVVTSAGNEGNISWQIISAPADAVDVLAVANVDANLERAKSSSIGPSSDLRIKPDVAALGTQTKVIEKSGVIGESSGTSLAAPLITSLAAGVLQRFPYLTNKQVISMIKKSSSQAYRPDNYIGYGIPNYKSLESYLLQEEDFSVYPNPFDSNSQELIIRPKDTVQASDCTLELLSADGKSVFKDQTFFSEPKEVYSPNLTDHANGIYLMRIGCPDRNYVYKVVKK